MVARCGAEITCLWCGVCEKTFASAKNLCLKLLTNKERLVPHEVDLKSLTKYPANSWAFYLAFHTICKISNFDEGVPSYWRHVS